MGPKHIHINVSKAELIQVCRTTHIVLIYVFVLTLGYPYLVYRQVYIVLYVVKFVITLNLASSDKASDPVLRKMTEE